MVTFNRAVHTQFTFQESHHRLARKIFHGQRGELRQAYREGQEDQLGALGLVLNAVVLWNTRYLAAAAALAGHLRQIVVGQGSGISHGTDDPARPAPAVWAGAGRVRGGLRHGVRRDGTRHRVRRPGPGYRAPERPETAGAVA
ncbi:DDE_Tnp_Tn3 domain-containing protein [Frankia sp. Hr75.2]|nr:DDE_Tnp_Tn3 domain-containing protein [Frankia sp. Hr75.2]